MSRNEANAASSAATSLSTSKNRGERLAAIEKQIAVLKTQADEKAASAQTAAETAQSERDALDKLRQEGEARRDELSSMIDSLDSQSAKQAAQTVLIASQVDSYNRQFQKEQQDAINADRAGQVGTGDRSEKIRTYNFPQDRCTDHRIGLTVHNLDKIMDGNLDDIIDALATREQAEKLQKLNA